jgi:hypothetical protein
MSRKAIASFSSFLLIILWVYASSSKLLNYEQTRIQMLNQVFPRDIERIFSWLIPTAELITGLMIIFNKTHLLGLFASFILLLCFSTYITGGLFHWYHRLPCSCGGVLGHIPWGWHLIFNIAFLIINAIALRLNFNERRYAVN